MIIKSKASNNEKRRKQFSLPARDESSREKKNERRWISFLFCSIGSTIETNLCFTHSFSIFCSTAKRMEARRCHLGRPSATKKIRKDAAASWTEWIHFFLVLIDLFESSWIPFLILIIIINLNVDRISFAWSATTSKNGKNSEPEKTSAIWREKDRPTFVAVNVLKRLVVLLFFASLFAVNRRTNNKPTAERERKENRDEPKREKQRQQHKTPSAMTKESQVPVIFSLL